jgi:hypothetical protein
MIQIWKAENGKEYVHGTARLIKEPRYSRGRKTTVASFSAVVDERDTGNKTADGRAIYSTTIYNFAAFRKLSEYCRNLEKGDMILFYGTRDIDDYWTERDENGEVHYKIALEFCMAQPVHAPDYGEDYGENPFSGEPDF